MKVALVSDSHGNLENINTFLTQIQSAKIDLVIHLGDDFTDAEPIMSAGYPCSRIPGTWCPAYEDPLIENRRIETYEQWRFLLSHTPMTDPHDLPDDPDPLQVMSTNKADIFVHGHTHRPECRPITNGYRLNPGHVKAQTDRGYPATYAILDLNSKTIQVKIIELFTQNIYSEQEISK